MTNDIVIIDYGLGNLLSVAKGFESLGYRSIVTNDPKQILNASKVVFPGVGHIGQCIQNMRSLHLEECIQKVVQKGVPFLGICVGLQMLFDFSDEAPLVQGMSLMKGKVQLFEGEMKVPHMGWNTISIEQSNCPLLKGIVDEDYFYFTHSYYVKPEDSSIVLTKTSYGESFVSSIWKQNVFGVQFHPEKSQKNGLKILKNFGEL